MRYVAFLACVLVGGGVLLFRRPYIRQMMNSYEKWGWPHGPAIERYVTALMVVVGLAFLFFGVLGFLGVIRQP